jgi:hypothetical protein
MFQISLFMMLLLLLLLLLLFSSTVSISDQLQRILHWLCNRQDLLHCDFPPPNHDIYSEHLMFSLPRDATVTLVFHLCFAGYRRPAHQAQPQPLRHDRVFSPVCSPCMRPAPTLRIKRRCSLIIIACSFIMIDITDIMKLMLGDNPNARKKVSSKPVVFTILSR